MSERPSRFSSEEHDRYYSLKKQWLAHILGPMHDLVTYAIIPFQAGGPLAIYHFPQSNGGTALATMELVEPDDSGPIHSRIGAHELVWFTRNSFNDSSAEEQFEKMELRVRRILTGVARYSYEAQLNPLDTIEIPGIDEDKNVCLALDEFTNSTTRLRFGGRPVYLLLCLEVFRSEMEYARQHRTTSLLELLKEHAYYPYSDMDRQPVV
jgi:hypothetical protein